MPFYINSRLFYSPSHLEKIDTLEDSKTKLLKRTLNRKRIKAIRVGDFRTEKFEINQNKFKVNIVASNQRNHLKNKSIFVNQIPFSQYVEMLYN